VALIKMYLCILAFFLGAVAAYFVCVGLYVRVQMPHKSIGFVHPYFSSGKDRVLWNIIKTLYNQDSSLSFLVYTGSLEEPSQIIFNALAMFGIDMTGINVSFIRLTHASFIDPSNSASRSKLLQFWGSICLTYEAILAQPCSLLIDTHGHAFGYWFVKGVCDIPVVAYVNAIEASANMASTQSSTRRKTTASFGRQLYCNLLALGYRFAGKFTKLVICNSAFTAEQISTVWDTTQVHVICPPCDVEAFKRLKHMPTDRHVAVSIGNFSLERGRGLQIEAIAILIRTHPELSNSFLVLIGVCSTAEDETRVSELRAKAASLGVGEHVEFKLNLKFTEVLSVIESAEAGLHTSLNDNLDMSVIELMAAGLITIAHSTGGLKADIISHNINGFVAKSSDEYADLLAHIFTNYPDLQSIPANARESVGRFSEEEFRRNIIRVMGGLSVFSY
jgi:alpha-1,2-mannosyltransferase